MIQSLPLRKCVESFVAEGVSRVRVDLRDCSYMDSTFMGTLLTLQRTLGKSNATLSLVMPSAACSRILQQMGLADILTAENEPVEWSGEWVVLENQVPDTQSFKRNITEAHEELVRLPGQAGEQFQAVIRCLNAEQSEDTKKPKS
jgi:anti-anti-sigma factor